MNKGGSLWRPKRQFSTQDIYFSVKVLLQQTIHSVFTRKHHKNLQCTCYTVRMWFHHTFQELRCILPRQIAFLFATSTFRGKFHQRMPHKRRFRNAVNASPAMAWEKFSSVRASKWIPGPRCSLFMFTRQLNAGRRLFPCHSQTDKCLPGSQISCTSLWGHSGSYFCAPFIQIELMLLVLVIHIKTNWFNFCMFPWGWQYVRSYDVEANFSL